MSFKEELDFLFSFHTGSPQYNFYLERFKSKLDNSLYDGSVSKYDYEHYTNRILHNSNSKIYSNSIGITDVIYQYNKLRGSCDILGSCSLPMIKVLRVLSSDINDCLVNSNYKNIDIAERYEHILGLLNKAIACFSDKDRKVYHYLNSAHNAILVCSVSHYPSDELCELYSVYFDLKVRCINQDSDFYKLYEDSYKNSDHLHNSNVFSNLDYFYKDYLIDECLMVRGLVCNTKTIIKDEIFSKLYKSNMTTFLKDLCTSSCLSEISRLSSRKPDYYSAFLLYTYYLEDFVFYCTKGDLDEGFSISSHILAITDPYALITFFYNRSDLESLSKGNDVSVFNTYLLSKLIELERTRFIDNSTEIYEILKRKVDTVD